MNLKSGLLWRLQCVRDARVVGYLSRRDDNREWNNPRERNMLHSTKLNGVGDLKSILTSDMKMYTLEFAKEIRVKRFP